ncbi:MAG: hypothetical protein ABWX92_11890 [Mycetocola sp.]
MTGTSYGIVAPLVVGATSIVDEPEFDRTALHTSESDFPETDDAVRLRPVPQRAPRPRQASNMGRSRRRSHDSRLIDPAAARLTCGQMKT